jgi:ABC-2 type transport system permease protein
MFGEIIRFEILYRLKQPIFYLFALIFTIMTFGAVSSDSVQVGGAVGNVARNSPYFVFHLLGMMSAIGLIAVTVYMTSAVNRDHEQRTQEILFSTPVPKWAYLTGRFIGAIIPSTLAITMSAIGIFVASKMPWQDPARIVPFSIMPYLLSILVFVIPNLFFAGALLFSVATLTRRVLLAWVGIIAFFSLWGISRALMGNLENEPLAALLDPLGQTPFRLSTQYWTVAEKNTLVWPLASGMLLNRVIWLAASFVVLGFTWARYRMALPETGSRRSLRRGSRVDRRGADATREPVDLASAEGLGSTPTDWATNQPAEPLRSLPIPERRFDGYARVRQWRHLAGTELRRILPDVGFVVLMLCGIGNLIGGMIASPGEAPSYPVTRSMLEAVTGAFTLMPILALAIYGANLVWRERRARMAEVMDALPIPNWIPLTAKLAALCAVAFVTLLLAMASTVTYQLVNGYTALEIGLYFKGLVGVIFTEFLFLAVLAVFVQVVSNDIRIGFLLIILVDLFVELIPGVGWEHHLLYYGTTPSVPYSDLNGYGQNLGALVWFKVYWAFLAVFLVLVSNLFWVRGTDNRLKPRVREAWRRLRAGPRPGRHLAPIILSFMGFLATGAWIYYNTNIVNEYRSDRHEKWISAQYEKLYKQYDGVLQPRIDDVRISVDFIPEDRRVDLRGTMRAVNRSREAIPRLHLQLSRDVTIHRINLPPNRIEVDDRETGYRICVLDRPLAPGDTMTLGFDLSVQPRGFVNGNANTKVLRNGTFFECADYLPRLGYIRENELVEYKDRKKHGLPARARALRVNDPRGLNNMAFTTDADWIHYEATLRTSPDQIAITCGTLDRRWSENGRSCFHYSMKAPIQNFYPFVSGRFAVREDRWRDVEIAIYYDRRHHYNIDRMIEAIQKSLDYYTANFGPYPYGQVRVVEFPGYREFAQSFPGTIPYSERADFIEDIRDPDNIDMVFYITAHEMGHQWWGDQLNGGDVQGATFLVESLTQYSALMVMEKEYGTAQMKKFLAYELRRYLMGRGRERIEEQPLMLVENQPYIHYQKGGLSLYALRDYIGEQTLNGALADFFRDKAHSGPPYTNSVELLEYLRGVTPPEYQYLIEDFFEKITLYDNRAELASCRPTGDGRYQVELRIQSRKYRADGQGIETEIDHNDWIEVGVYGKAVDGTKDGRVLHLEKHRLRSGTNRLLITVDEEPVRAGVDPRNLLIDRVPGDNLKKIGPGENAGLVREFGDDG